MIANQMFVCGSSAAVRAETSPALHSGRVCKRSVVLRQLASQAATRDPPSRRALNKDSDQLHQIQESEGDAIHRYHKDTSGEWVRVEQVESTASSRLFERIRGLYIPQGFPDTVTPDYLPYQLWACPVHITGWMAHSLVTSSMLKAVNVGVDPASAAAAGAAIKWITKDGVGALGRFFVGGSLSRYFDEDPRHWRLLAEIIGVLGSLLEILVAIVPGGFVFLTSSGTFAKALSRGISRPSFRVIETYFAKGSFVGGSNIGDVAAKEEVWEVTGQLMGLALSVAVLEALQRADSSGSEVVLTWAAITVAHIAFRYKSMRVLQFPWLSQKRTCMLSKDFLENGTVQSVQELNSVEPVMIPKQLMEPSLFLNGSIPQLRTAADAVKLATTTPSDPAQSSTNNNGSEGTLHQPLSPPDNLSVLMSIYEDEGYVLVPGAPTLTTATLCQLLQRDALIIGVKDTSKPVDMLQAVLQATWIVQQVKTKSIESVNVRELLEDSLAAAKELHPGFVSALEEKGWQIDSVLIRSMQSNVLQMAHTE